MALYVEDLNVMESKLNRVSGDYSSRKVLLSLIACLRADARRVEKAAKEEAENLAEADQLRTDLLKFVQTPHLLPLHYRILDFLLSQYLADHLGPERTLSGSDKLYATLPATPGPASGHSPSSSASPATTPPQLVGNGLVTASTSSLDGGRSHSDQQIPSLTPMPPTNNGENGKGESEEIRGRIAEDKTKAEAIDLLESIYRWTIGQLNHGLNTTNWSIDTRALLEREGRI